MALKEFSEVIRASKIDPRDQWTHRDDARLAWLSVILCGLYALLAVSCVLALLLALPYIALRWCRDRVASWGDLEHDLNLPSSHGCVRCAQERDRDGA